MGLSMINYTLDRIHEFNRSDIDRITDEIATEEGNKEVAKKSLSGAQKVFHMRPERLDLNIKVWLEDMRKH